MIITFDHLFYTFIYSDVSKNYYLAKKHFLTIGIKQNRYGSIFHFYSINPSFKWNEYTNYTPPYTELNSIKNFILFNPIIDDKFTGVLDLQTRITEQIDNVTNYCNENKQEIVCLYEKMNNIIIPTNDNLKINISPLENILNKVIKLNPISFNRNDNFKKEFGFISSEVNTLLEIDTQEPNEFDYITLIPLLVQSIKELNEKNTLLDNEIKRLNYIINNGYY